MTRRSLGPRIIVVTMFISVCLAAGCGDVESWAPEREGLEHLDPETARFEGLSPWSAQRLQPFECDGNAWIGDYVISTDEDIERLQGMARVTGAVIVASPSVTTLHGLECLQEVGGLRIHDADSLTDLHGLRALEVIHGDFSIIASDALTNLDGLGSLTTVEGPMRLYDNSMLEDVDGLISLERVQRLVLIRTNARLASLDGLGELALVGGDLVILANPSLSDLGLFSLGIVGRDVWIQNNPRLSACEISGLVEQLRALSYDGVVHGSGNGPAMECR